MSKVCYSTSLLEKVIVIANPVSQSDSLKSPEVIEVIEFLLVLNLTYNGISLFVT